MGLCMVRKGRSWKGELDVKYWAENFIIPGGGKTKDRKGDH